MAPLEQSFTVALLSILQSSQCWNVENMQIKKETSYISHSLFVEKSSCKDLSQHVSIVNLQSSQVACVWQFNHFDFGIIDHRSMDPLHIMYSKMPVDVCLKFNSDCQVSFFSDA